MKSAQNLMKLLCLYNFTKEASYLLILYLFLLQITWIKMTMPNKHYLNIDMSKFPANVTKGDPRHQIYQPIDKPAGLIYAQLRRRPKSHL